MKITRICPKTRSSSDIVEIAIVSHSKCQECEKEKAEFVLEFSPIRNAHIIMLCNECAWKLADALNETPSNDFLQKEV